MSSSLTPKQVLILWYLVGKGGAAWLDAIRPKPKPAAAWRALQNSGLISSEKRQRETPTQGARRKKSKITKPTRRSAFWIEVTERGWAWANEHLDSQLPPQTESAGPILQAWLTHLQAFLRQRGLALADVITARPGTVPSDVEAGPLVALEDRIRSAYLDATGGAWNKRVRLSELRTLLEGVQRAELDKILMRMQQDGALVLYPLDNPQEITTADRDAAIAIGGSRLHIVYMRG